MSSSVPVMKVMRTFLVFLIFVIADRTNASGRSDQSACISFYTSQCLAGSSSHVVLEDIDQSGPTVSGNDVVVFCVENSSGITSSSYDCVFSMPFPDGAPPPPGGSPPPKCPGTAPGSVIDVDAQAVSERIPIAGADFSLNYSSRWAASRLGDYKISVPLSGSPAESGVTSFEVKVSVLGNVISTTSVTNADYATFDGLWSGLDSSSNPVLGSIIADVAVDENAAGTSIQIKNVPVGNLKAKLLGFGGWMPSNFHFYDVARKTLFRGDGSAYAVKAIALGSGDLLVPEEGGKVVYEFSSSGKHLYTKTALIGTTIATYNYNGAGLLTSIAEPYSRTTTFTRDMAGKLTSITTPDGIVTSVTIDSNNLLTAVTNPNSESYGLTYASGTDLLATFTKPGAQSNSFTYDSDGFLTYDVHSGGHSVTLSASAANLLDGTRVETSAVGRVKTSYLSNALGAGTPTYTRNEYEPSGAVRTVTESPTSLNLSAGGVSINRTFADDIRFGAAAQFLTGYTFGSRSETSAQGLSLYTSTDPFSINTLTTTRTLNGYDTQTVFHGSASSLITTSPVGRVRTKYIDSYERVISDQWGADTAKSYAYTDDKLTSIVQGYGTTTFSYGTSGLLTSLTNAMGETTSFTYDSARRPTYLTYPDSRAIQFTYDSNGNLTGITPPGRSLHGFVLNGHELLDTYQPPTLSGVSVVNTTYQYNDDRQMTQVNRPDGQVININYGSSTGNIETIEATSGTSTFSFDTSSENYSYAATSSGIASYLSYSYGSISNDTEYNGSTYVGSVAPSLNSLMQYGSETVSPASGSPRTINYLYDNDELLKKAGDLTITRNATSGRISATALGSATDSWSYNTKGELTGYTFNYGTSPLYTYSITRDEIGRVTDLVDTVQGTSNSYAYSYDNSARLTDVTKNSAAYSHYAYDLNSNGTSGFAAGSSFTASVDAQDRLSTYNSTNYTYNANGELTKSVNTVTYGTTSFTYDSFGNLKSVKPPTGSTISYDYDGFGRRFLRKVGSTVQSYYLYVGSRIVAEMNASGAFKKQFIYGTKPNVPDYMFIGSTKYRLVTDQLGSVRLVVKTTDGSISQKIEYSDRGLVTSDSNPGFQPFGYAGGLYDNTAQLVHFGARDYDPQTGRWLTKDPIGFEGGDQNLFGYVGSDSINFIDPSGLYMSPSGGPGDGAGGSAGGSDGGGAGCQHDNDREADYKICRSVQDAGARARCWESAAQRDGARRNNRIPPPLITQRVPIIFPFMPLLPRLLPALLLL